MRVALAGARLMRLGVPGVLTLLSACALWETPGPPGAAALARYGAPEIELTRPPGYDAEVAALDALGPTAPLETDPLTEEFAPVPEAPPLDRAPDADGPLRLSVEEAVVLALRNNRSLRVQQLDPVIAGTFEDIERAVFDPELFAAADLIRDERQQTDRATGQQFSVTGEGSSFRVGGRQLLPTGTDVELSLRHARDDSDRTPEQNTARVGLTLTQALLRGASLEANLAQIRQAEIDTLVSIYELRGFAELLVADVELTYWNYVLARRQIEIFEQSLEVARQQQRETERRVAVGLLAETELAAARAEVALREQLLIDARSAVERTRLALLRLLDPPSAAGWARLIEPVAEPVPPELALDQVEDHVALGLRLRPELNQARLQVQRGRLEVVQTRNGLLPVLDLFITLGKSGYAASFGESFRSLDDPGYDVALGLQAAYPIGNRGPQAFHRRALAARDQAVRSVDNLAQLVSLDVRTAWLEVERTRQQVAASAVTRAAQEEVVRAELAKFAVGNATAFTVAQAERDLLESRIAEVDAAVAYRQALVELYRLEGTLLERRGIAAPGARPVEIGLPIS
jgi:outer membrane protein TolC